MELFHRNSGDVQDQATVSGLNDAPELESPTVEKTDQETPSASGYNYMNNRNWRTIALQAATALIVLVIIVFGGRWLHHELSHKTNVKVASANTKQLPAAPSATSGSGSSPTALGNSSNSTSSSSSSSAQNSNLPNTGPGDDLAIFLAVSLAVASLHYARNARKS